MRRLLLLSSTWAVSVVGFAPGIHLENIQKSSSSSPLWPLFDASTALYEIQEQMLVDRGKLEEALMKDNYTPLEANKPKGVGGSGGFGGAKSNKKSYKEEAKSHAEVLRRDGVVRIDRVLSDKVATKLRAFVIELRMQSTEEVQSGAVRPLDRFADVLLKQNRCDLKIPLGEKIVTEALQSVFLQSAVKDTIEAVLGKEATLYELACLVSDPGSQRQVIHPDNPCLPQRTDPTLLTCFIALQDVDWNMGPTVWIPGTHTHDIHEQFQDESVTQAGEQSPKDRLLASKPSVLGLLSKGSCAIFDSRLLHCGSANRDEEISRALFYFSMKNPNVGYPGNVGSIRKEIGSANLSLEELAQELGKKKSPRLQGIASSQR